MKKVIIYFIVFFSTLNCFAKQIRFFINGHGKNADIRVPITLEWNDSWLTEGDTRIYNHNLARVAGMLCAVSYSDCSDAKNCLMTETYSKLGFGKDDIEYFYDIDYFDKKYTINQNAFSFAVKKIAGGRDMVFVVLRGTPGNLEEWLSNLNIDNERDGDTTYHEGFFKVVENIREHFDEFVESRDIDLKKSCLLITGHSRGAAAANLLSALLADDGVIDKQNTFTYTFATPNVTTRKDVHDERYNFIWNIINGEDLIPTVPPNNNKKWTFTKFGRTCVIINSWNCADPKIYYDEYVGKMNAIYEQFANRKYAPFGTGTFVGVKSTDTVSLLNKDVKHYYKGIFPLSKRMSHAMAKTFLSAEQTEALNKLMEQMDKEKLTKEEKIQRIKEQFKKEKAVMNAYGDSTGGIERIVSTLKKHVNTHGKIIIDYTLEAAVDMHAMQSYLSWICALDGSEVFSERESTIVRIHGSFNGAVVDEKGNIYATIQDGILRLRETKVPIAAWQIPIFNFFGPISLGFPSNKDFSLLVYKNSLLPTPVKLEIEHYSSEGLSTKKVFKKIATPHLGLVYSFKTGKSSVEGEQEYERLRGKDAKLAIKDGKLKAAEPVQMSFEFNVSTEGFIELGANAGFQKFYLSGLFGIGKKDSATNQMFAVGLGTQHAFCGPIMLNLEGYAKFVCCSKDDEWRYNLVPSIRTLFEVKAGKRIFIFTGFEFDLCFDGLNDNVFENGYKSKGLPVIGSGSSRAYPEILFGIKL